jgi:hypothetical protein
VRTGLDGPTCESCNVSAVTARKRGRERFIGFMTKADCSEKPTGPTRRDGQLQRERQSKSQLANMGFGRLNDAHGLASAFAAGEQWSQSRSPPDKIGEKSTPVREGVRILSKVDRMMRMMEATFKNFGTGHKLHSRLPTVERQEPRRNFQGPHWPTPMSLTCRHVLRIPMR